jgi:hypothetical protein
VVALVEGSREKQTDELTRPLVLCEDSAAPHMDEDLTLGESRRCACRALSRLAVVEYKWCACCALGHLVVVE